jgi:CBS domain-containing protein
METAGDHMSSPVLTIDQNENINNAAKKIYANQIGSLLVTQDKKFIGIITKTDLMVKVLIKNLDGNSTRVSEVMSQPLISIDVDEPLESAKKLFNEKPIRHLPVTRNNEVVGILSTKDLR